ncbi:MAG: hypothetical protein IPM58_12285 [Nitrospira sp.]|nr:hypothetical protein [Nitrospira sp.]
MAVQYLLGRSLESRERYEEACEIYQALESGSRTTGTCRIALLDCIRLTGLLDLERRRPSTRDWRHSGEGADNFYEVATVEGLADGAYQ